MISLTRFAYAKINLTLDVGARRPDGYHEIRSIMQTVTLHDTVTVTLTPDVPGVSLEVVGEEADGVPADSSNLVHKAAVRLQKIAAARQKIAGNQSGLHITLHKRIPSQAGLGGGSSDAAATLLAINVLLGLALSHARLTEIGAALGADVPFFLTGGTALVEGLGERVTRLPPLAPAWPLVIVKPSVDISTARAYAALDAMTERQAGRATAQWLTGGSALSNDFETVILPTYPEVSAVSSLLSETAQTDESFKPLLCGSGAAVFRRAATQEDAERLAALVRKSGQGKAWVTKTQTETQGEIE